MIRTALRLHLIRLILAVLVVVVLASVARPAGAKVPGPNGMIAFVRSSNTGADQTYIMNPDGTQLQLLLRGAEAVSPHWSPDGSLLALQTSFKGGCPPCQTTTILNPDTGHKRVLAPPDPNIATGCSLWSPDASHFACDGENDNNPSVNGLYTIRTSDGQGLTRITNAGGAADIPIDYSPDGKQIVFGRVDPSNHHCTKTSALYVVNVDGTGLREITPGGFCDDDGSWSPDGREIVFAPPGGSIFVVHPDGTGLSQIPLATNSRAFGGDASWSPDGTKIAFILTTPVGPPSGGPSADFQEGIATASADGTDVQQITTAPTTPDPLFDHEEDWGPHPLITP